MFWDLFFRKSAKAKEEGRLKPRAVAFVDYEHWYIALDNQYGIRPDIKGWRDELSQKYDLSEIIIFADFSNPSLRAEISRIREVTNIIIETQNSSPTYTKDFTDFIMLDHIYQKTVSSPDIDVYIIFTGDGHFSSAVSFIMNRLNKPVVIYGVRNSLSNQLRNTASEVYEIPAVAPAVRRGFFGKGERSKDKPHPSRNRRGGSSDDKAKAEKYKLDKEKTEKAKLERQSGRKSAADKAKPEPAKPEKSGARQVKSEPVKVEKENSKKAGAKQTRAEKNSAKKAGTEQAETKQSDTGKAKAGQLKAEQARAEQSKRDKAMAEAAKAEKAAAEAAAAEKAAADKSLSDKPDSRKQNSGQTKQEPAKQPSPKQEPAKQPSPKQEPAIQGPEWQEKPEEPARSSRSKPSQTDTVDRIIEKLARDKEAAKSLAAGSPEPKAKPASAGAVVTADAVSISGAAASWAQPPVKQQPAKQEGELREKPENNGKRQKKDKSSDKTGSAAPDETKSAENAAADSEKPAADSNSNGQNNGNKNPRQKANKSKKDAAGEAETKDSENREAAENDKASKEKREERKTPDFEIIAARILANLRYLDEVNKSRQRPAQPTFRGTVDAVARVNRMPKSAVADALRRLIENGVITQSQQTVGGNPDVKVITVDWAAAESYEAPNRPDADAASDTSDA
ncbi:MAG: NYN domain-containing protein [Clostridiales bacterium]|nr:NYN domain-containing protein [Clostridiales bacterium]